MRIGITSTTLGYVPNSFQMTTPSIVDHAIGQNVGNLAFRFAVDQHIESAKVHVPWGADIAWVREQCDLLVIPSANQVHPTIDLGPRADFLEAVDLPCLAVGLGAQAASLHADLSIPHGTLRYLRNLSQRCHTIGVRGEYTAGVLAKLGIRNTAVVGCPANFINPLTELGQTVERKLNSITCRRLIVTAGDLRPEHRRVERKLFRWLLNREGAYVCQSNYELISLARNRTWEVAASEVDELRRYLQPTSRRLKRRSEFLTMARERFRVFFDVGAWLEFLAAFDLSLGTRLHGNLLALQAGTLGICIHHDARTKELCETTTIPHLSIKTCLAAKSLGQLVEKVHFDGGKFDRRRTDLARTYRALLLDRGIKVSHGLNRLVEGGSRPLVHAISEAKCP